MFQSAFLMLFIKQKISLSSGSMHTLQKLKFSLIYKFVYVKESPKKYFQNVILSQLAALNTGTTDT